MRTLTIFFTVVATVCSPILCFGQPSPLSLVVQPLGYTQPVYTADPQQGASLVIFTGEPFSLRVIVFNQGATLTQLLTDEAPGITVRVRQDGTVIDAPVLFSETVDRTFAGRAVPDSWRKSMGLAPKESITWTAQVQLADLMPGLYTIEAIVPGTDENGLQVRRQYPELSMEIRARTQDAEQELALRAAIRLHRSERLSEAEEALRAMIARFHNSAVAHSQLARILSAQGRRDEAIRSTEASLALLERNADTSLLKWRPAVIPNLFSGLTDSVNEMRTQASVLSPK